MRMLITAILLAAASPCMTLFCDEVPPAVREMSLSELDVHIKNVQEQIKIYRRRAIYADREAQRLMTRDFLAYRRYLLERDRDLETVAALQEELAILEQQKARRSEEKK